MFEIQIDTMSNYNNDKDNYDQFHLGKHGVRAGYNDNYSLAIF